MKQRQVKPPHKISDLSAADAIPMRVESGVGHITTERRGHRLRKTIKLLLLLLAAAVIAIIIYVVQFLGRLSVNPLDLRGLAVDSNGRTTILILGIGDPGHSGEKLSDTNMLLILDHQSRKVAMISIPRDLRVPIPGYGRAKLNSANALGGPTLAEDTITQSLGIPIEYYLETDFSGLRQSVDAVGGLDVMVKDRLVDPEFPCSADESKACGLDLIPGNYHMDGTMALQYARCRKGTCGNDFGRAARQQEIIHKLQAKIFTPGVYLNPVRLMSLSAAVTNNSKTDLSPNQLVATALALHAASQTTNLVLSTNPGGLLMDDPYGTTDLLPLGGNFDQIAQSLQNIFNN